MKGYVMRPLMIAAVLIAAGCASQEEIDRRNGQAAIEAVARWQAVEENRRVMADIRREQEAAEQALSPTERAQRALSAAKITRENELLERALSGSPDYSAAVKRVATANVDGEAAIPTPPGAPRRPAMTQRAREAAIAIEEARLSEAVELRRRQSLSQQAAVARAQQDQQAAIICRARGQVAGSQPAFGGFGIGGAINAGMQQGWAAANAEAACFNAYRATGIMPSL